MPWFKPYTFHCCFWLIPCSRIRMLFRRLCYLMWTMVNHFFAILNDHLHDTDFLTALVHIGAYWYYQDINISSNLYIEDLTSYLCRNSIWSAYFSLMFSIVITAYLTKMYWIKCVLFRTVMIKLEENKSVNNKLIQFQGGWQWNCFYIY